MQRAFASGPSFPVRAASADANPCCCGWWGWPSFFLLSLVSTPNFLSNFDFCCAWLESTTLAGVVSLLVPPNAFHSLFLNYGIFCGLQCPLPHDTPSLKVTQLLTLLKSLTPSFWFIVILDFYSVLWQNSLSLHSVFTHSFYQGHLSQLPCIIT